MRGVTLEGGGQVTLTDNSQNVIFGGDASAVLDNANNTISGAGQLGQGQLTLHNEGTIAATGTNPLVIDTGANAVVNTGLLKATGAGGLVVDSAVTGGGTAEIGGASSIEFAVASDAAVSFDAGASGTLKLDQSGTFGGTIHAVVAWLQRPAFRSFGSLVGGNLKNIEVLRLLGMLAKASLPGAFKIGDLSLLGGQFEKKGDSRSGAGRRCRRVHHQSNRYPVDLRMRPDRLRAESSTAAL